MWVINKINASAINLKTFTVTFNEEINEESLKVSAKKGKGNVLESFQLLDDKKTVVGVYNGTGISQSDKIDFVISAKSADKTEEVKEYEESVVVTDKETPTFVGAKALNAKQIELQFSEPIKDAATAGFVLLNNIKIDGQAAVAKVSANDVKNTLTLTLANELKAGSFEIEASDLKDYAGFKITKGKFNVTVVEDKDAPKAVKAEVISKDKVRVTFDESVEVEGNFKVNDKSDGFSVAVVPNTDKKVWEISGLDLDLGAIIEVKVEYKGQQDVLGNTVKEYQTILTQAKNDTVKPTVNFELGDKNKATLTFSKSMKTGTGKITVLDKDGKKHAETNVTTFKSKSDDKVLELSASTLKLNDVDAGSYTLVIEDMKDASIRGNALGKQEFKFTAADTKAPTVIGDAFITEAKNAAGEADKDNDTITIFFSEVMEKESAESLSNYFLGDTPLSGKDQAVSAKLSADGKSVVIVYKDARSITSGTKMKVASVKDAAGNIISGGIQESIDLAKASSKTLTQKDDIVATDKNTIKVVFNTPLATVSPEAFAVQMNSDGGAVTGLRDAKLDPKDPTNQTVIFTTAIDLGTDSAKYKLVLNDASVITNIYGQELSGFTGVQLKDEVRPEVTKVEKIANTKNQFKIVFSEVVKDSSSEAAKADLIIKKADGTILADNDYNISDLSGSASTDLIVTIKSNVTDGKETFTVEMPNSRNIKDTAGKVLKPFDAMTVKDVVIELTQPAATSFGIDYANEKTAQAIPETVEYNTDNDFTTPNTDGAGAAIDLTPGENVFFRVKAKDGVPAGAVQTLTVPETPAAISETYTAKFPLEATLIKLAGLANSATGLEAAVAIDGSTYAAYAPITVDASGNATITGLTGVTTSTKVKVRKAATSTSFVGTDKEVTASAEE